jgi:hypothetical protein
MKEFAHATLGEPSPEGLLDPVAHLRRGLEAAGGDLTLEVVELGRLESAWIPLVVESAQGLQAVAAVQLQPVADGAGADAEEIGNLLNRSALTQPEQGR